MKSLRPDPRHASRASRLPVSPRRARARRPPPPPPSPSPNKPAASSSSEPDRFQAASIRHACTQHAASRDRMWHNGRRGDMCTSSSEPQPTAAQPALRSPTRPARAAANEAPSSSLVLACRHQAQASPLPPAPFRRRQARAHHPQARFRRAGAHRRQNRAPPRLSGIYNIPWEAGCRPLNAVRCE